MRREYSDPELRWAAKKHRMGYGWDAIAKALALPLSSLRRRVQRSGYACEPPLLLPPEERILSDMRRRIEWEWEMWLEGYSFQQIGDAVGRSGNTIAVDMRTAGYRKVMPPLVTTWIFGWKGSRK